VARRGGLAGTMTGGEQVVGGPFLDGQGSRLVVKSS
jgi:hypothetical protein